MLHSTPEVPRQFNGDFSADFLSVEQLTPRDLATLHAEADAFQAVVTQRGRLPLLENSVYGTVFWDSLSTRTKHSFEFAVKRLGAEVVDVLQAVSSSGKGESYESTVEMVDAWMVPGRDALITRHNKAGTVARAAALIDAYVINAGDGTGEHPTQAVLDTKTVRSYSERGLVPPMDEVNFMFFGDLAHSRAANSTAPLLVDMGIRTITLVAPHPGLAAPRELAAKLRRSGATVTETDDFQAAARSAHFIYGMRTQREFIPPEEYSEYVGKCLITPEMMLESQARIMHPLPENEEDLNIHPELRADARCIVKEQAGNGQSTRGAFLALQAGKSIIRAARQYGIELPSHVLQTAGE
ncbi:MAG TPA: hypothetical protein VFL85_02520 [Candidatus Saccharimonadales bacterium]|nr:hypothetical protein [Candidatus Saccharimonadales bacterium]